MRDPNQASPDRIVDPDTGRLNIFYRNYRLVRNPCQHNDGKKGNRTEEEVCLTHAHIDAMIDYLQQVQLESPLRNRNRDRQQ